MRLSLAVIGTLIALSAISQPIGVINEEREEVIVRSGRDYAYAVVGRIREGEKFNFWPEEDQTYWYIESENREVKGFVLGKQISYFYPQEGTDCLCSGPFDKRPIMVYNAEGSSIIVCGDLLQKKDENEITIRRFSVQDCITNEELASYGPVETCFVKKTGKNLIIQSVKKLPVGRNWTPKRIPISQQRVLFIDGNPKISNRELVVEMMIPPLQIEQFLKGLERLKGKGQVVGEDYELIINKLLSSALAYNEEASTLLKNANDYFGFDLSGKYRSSYYTALALVEAKTSN